MHMFFWLVTQPSPMNVREEGQHDESLRKSVASHVSFVFPVTQRSFRQRMAAWDTASRTIWLGKGTIGIFFVAGTLEPLALTRPIFQLQFLYPVFRHQKSIP